MIYYRVIKDDSDHPGEGNNYPLFFDIFIMKNVNSTHNQNI